MKGGYSTKDLENINCTNKGSIAVSEDCQSVLLVGSDGKLKELSIRQPGVKGRNIITKP